ncbi:MAG: AMP-binding protein, partial [Deltaproteobacteria bacterium]|nr:AMP-binding protein [Deltaproteobacteria bacterium]
MDDLIRDLSVGRVPDRGAERVPDKVAVVDGDRRTTYRELRDMVDAMAAALSDFGFAKGDRVAMYMKNSLEFEVLFYALQKLGLVVAWVNPNYRRTEAGFILGNSGARAIAVFQEWEGYDYLEAVMAMRSELPELERIIVVGDGEGQGVHRYEDLLAHGTGRTPPAPHIDTRKDLSMLIYTSGTTGKPKGAMITQYQVLGAAREYARGLQASSEDIFIGFLPMSHSYGAGAILVQPLLAQSA